METGPPGKLHNPEAKGRRQTANASLWATMKIILEFSPSFHPSLFTPFIAPLSHCFVPVTVRFACFSSPVVHRPWSGGREGPARIYTFNFEPETRNPKPETRNPKPETRNFFLISPGGQKNNPQQIEHEEQHALEPDIGNPATFPDEQPQ